jgi:hypothetical protein
MLMNSRQNSSFARLNPESSVREREDIESVFDDLLYNQGPSSSFFPSSPIRSSPPDFITPEYNPICDLGDGGRSLPSEFTIPNEPALDRPPSYDEIKHERISGSPQSDSSQPMPGSTGHPPRFIAGPYGKFKDDSGKIDIGKITDPAERRKVLEKREKNRIAAARARNRKREKTEDLEEEKAQLSQQISGLDAETQRLRDLRNTLNVVLNEHDKLCPFLRNHRYQT